MLIYGMTFCIVVLIMGMSVLKIETYNNTKRHKEFVGNTLFSESNEKSNPVSVNAMSRSSTWSKIFDFNNEGLTDFNYQAYTYDFSILNNTNDEVSEFLFKLTFDHEVFLSSAWNGALEIHQNVGKDEIVEKVPDLRVFDASAYNLDTVTFDGETLIRMNKGDYLIYYPSSNKNAMEMPIEPLKGTNPGMIMYIAIGESIEVSKLELQYRFHRLLQREPLFWIAVVGMMIWLIALTIQGITALQIRKYNERHKHDNEMIREAIETFIGFIDAKDGYTNGHSMRVADYTRLLAKELGFEGEELDRIYYVALLHDCGKIGVPDSILCKPGKLTDEEFEVIKSHTVRGSEILSHFKSLKNVGEGARYHHERYDGRGYPEGKAGEDIPFIARIICVADSFDAMNSNRVYRKKLTREHIINEIESNKGKQFDPKVADVMLKLIEEGKIMIAE